MGIGNGNAFHKKLMLKDADEEKFLSTLFLHKLHAFVFLMLQLKARHTKGNMIK